MVNRRFDLRAMRVSVAVSNRLRIIAKMRVAMPHAIPDGWPVKNAGSSRACAEEIMGWLVRATAWSAAAMVSLFGLSAFGLSAADAQTGYPDHPVRIIV